MSVELAAPADLTFVLNLDDHAPRTARHRVCQVGNPSPDLRDVVCLLTSEIVTLAAELAPERPVELRVWMSADVVRVETRGPSEMVAAEPGPRERMGRMLLDQLADRWAAEPSDDGGQACIWFEIDRHPVQ